MSIVVVVKVSNAEDQAPAVFSNLRDDGAVLKPGQVCMNGYIYFTSELQSAINAVEAVSYARPSNNGIGSGSPLQW